MHRSRVSGLGFCLFTLAVSTPLLVAQEQSTAQSAPAEANVPGQPGGTVASATATPPAGGVQPAAKKVWTNSDLQDLRANSPISTIGKPNSPQASTYGARGTSYAAKNQQWYAGQITGLEAQLSQLDKKIADLQAGVSGKFTGNSQTSSRPVGVWLGDWNSELSTLQKRRTDLEARIETLRAQAHQAGISPNSLP